MTDDQLRALGYTRPEHGIFRQTPVYYLSKEIRLHTKAAGLDYPITPPLESVAYNVKEYVPVSLPEPSKTDGRILWDSLIRNPFDEAPRSALADYLSESGLFQNAVNTLESPAAVEYKYQPFWTRLCGWEGPGVLGCFNDGLVDAWLGSMAQFMQACRSGLFTEFPITNVLIWDRQPLPEHGHNPRASERSNRFRWFYTQNSTIDTRNDLWRCVIADIFVIFMREYHSASSQGYKDEENPRYVCYTHPAWATLAISQAMVNVGRYAAGLPILKFPLMERDESEKDGHGAHLGNGNYSGDIGLWWQKWKEWQTVYRAGVKLADGEFAASVLSRHKLP